MATRGHGDPYGTHRVLRPAGVLPQAAEALDASLPIFDNEIRIDVATLNIDSASFRQMKEAAGGDRAKVGETVAKTVAARGKQHNPVTSSGGMLLGTVAEIGPAYQGRVKANVGDRIATLVSLSLTPLSIAQVKRVRPEGDMIDVEGHAILFETGIAAVMPKDLPEAVALAALDVCGAPAEARRLAKRGRTIVVLGGGGKSGTLVLSEARHAIGRGPGAGLLIGLDAVDAGIERMNALGAVDHARKVDARDAAAVRALVADLTEGRMADVVINCANVPHTEMATILSAKDDGLVYFFSTATSFTAAQLGAEGVGHGATLVIGNGYVPGHAELTLDLLRRDRAVRELFEREYAR
jgi:L-erythro-3,5-diaminohexanoate dehydrogenase